MPPLPQPFKTAPRRVRRKRRGADAATTPATLTLVSAIYEGDDTPYTVTLVFDRAVSTTGLVGTTITVRDAAINERTYKATGAVTRPDAVTVRIVLVEQGPFAGDDVELTATSGNGIVAVGDGAAWAGCTNVVLPFP